MKKFVLALSAILGTMLLTPTNAEAGGCRTRVTYDDYGACLHWEYRCVGRAYDGCPVYRWVVVSRSYPRSDYGYGYGSGFRGPRIDIHLGGGRGHGHSHGHRHHRH
jgi:hypothetical protein